MRFASAYRICSKDDRKNLGVLDTAIVQYGVQSELKETTQKLVEERSETNGRL
jgi:hypothetical protein